ncbi:MAG: EcsC family protein [Solirubrobacterales bacterium]
MLVSGQSNEERGFTVYELRIIQEIAEHIVQPGPVTALLETIGKPVNFLMEWVHKSDNKIARTVVQSINKTTDAAMTKTIKGANHLTSDKAILKEYNKKGIQIDDISDIARLDLLQMDTVANSFDIGGAVVVGTEGAVMGLAATLCEGAPGAPILIPAIVAADISASMVLLSRNVCQVATSYGFSSQIPDNLPHILAAMVPIASSFDEGFMAAKTLAINEVREAAAFIKKPTKYFAKELFEQAPKLIKFAAQVSERLGITITQKELGMLVPAAGIVFNGGINIAFQQAGHASAVDYFRVQTLSERYGAEKVVHAISEAKDKLEKQIEPPNKQKARRNRPVSSPHE